MFLPYGDAMKRQSSEQSDKYLKISWLKKRNRCRLWSRSGVHRKMTENSEHRWTQNRAPPHLLPSWILMFSSQHSRSYLIWWTTSQPKLQVTASRISRRKRSLQVTLVAKTTRNRISSCGGTIQPGVDRDCLWISAMFIRMNRHQ